MGNILHELYAKIKEIGQTLYDKIVNAYNKLKAFGDNFKETVKTGIYNAFTKVTESWNSLCNWLYEKTFNSNSADDDTVQNELPNELIISSSSLTDIDQFVGSVRGFMSWDKHVFEQTRGRCHMNVGELLEPLVVVFVELLVEFVVSLLEAIHGNPDVMVRFGQRLVDKLKSKLQTDRRKL
ncbi:hypothetical protein RND81_12G009700 [Saponaria officinalis]|uniref:Uncharacterized protein n=1 Tax=Saponaria officinalis TaxID=3572 RepID=A0AAW1H1U2_SAPOF